MPDQRPAILFDDGKGLLAPLTDLRPAYAIRNGPLTIAERLIRTFNLRIAAAFVPAPLAELAREQINAPVNQLPTFEGDEPVLLLSARLALPMSAIAQLMPGQVLADREGHDMIAALLPPADATALLSGGNPEMTHTLVDNAPLLRRPWDVRAHLAAAFDHDLALLARDTPTRNQLPPGVFATGGHTLAIHPETQIAPGVVFDASAGPIVIDENVSIQAHAVITGPVYVGPGSEVRAMTQLKPLTAIGPVCKVAGEIGGTVFQGYANKGHEGHLGDAWVGEWANLGASTVNSNLLNTYSEIVASPPGGKREKTGLTFFGCVLGDHVKTAIGTRIMTGSIVGTGTMHAASAALAGTVAPFAWATDAGTRTYRVGKFMEVAMAAMGRRGIAPSQAYSRRLTILHEAATGEHAAVNWPGKTPAEARAGGA